MPLEKPQEAKKNTTIYNSFRGVDFTNTPSSVWKKRTPTGYNLTPTLNGSPRKRTGWKIEVTQAMFKEAYPYPFDIEIKNIYSFELAGQDQMIIFCNCGVFAFTDNKLKHLVSLDAITNEPYRGFFFEGRGTSGFYFFGNKNLYAYKYNEIQDTFTCGVVEGYIPTTLISRLPSGGGEVLDPVNLLTRRRKESFLGNETDKTYYLSMQVDVSQEVIVKVKNDKGEFIATTDFTLNGTESTVVFNEPKKPVVEGEDNVLIEYATSIINKSVNAFFDNKTIAIYGTGLINAIFCGGCSDDDYSSRVWYSQIGDPTYFPDTNYFVAGSNDTKIMGLVKVGEYLGCIKQGDTLDSTIYLAYPVNFDNNTAYAVKQSVVGIGALSKRCFSVLGDESLFLSSEGIMAIEPTKNDNERQVKNRSFYINKKLLDEADLEKAISFVWNGFYILAVNGHCYLLDSSQKSSWANEKTNLQYECYYWENIPAICFGHYNDFLWFGDSKGNLCRFKTEEQDGLGAYSDNGEIIPCEWSTPLDNDGATNFFKNLQKKGCLVTVEPMAKTGADIYIKADDKEETKIGSVALSDMTTPYEFYFNKKVKKYKRLQIIIKNNGLNEGFGISEIIKIYTTGNYSKNRGGDIVR